MSHSDMATARRRWNHPRINIFRTNICFFSFFNCGIINGSFGPLIPPLEANYSLTYTTVSFIFLTLIPGYIISAFITDYLVATGGRRLIAILSAGLRLTSAIVVALHPPFAAIMSIMLLSGLGTAMVDSTWNVYIGTMEHTHQLLGLLHGIFGIGCTMGQVFASVVLANQGKPWYYYYYFQLSSHALELVLATIAFWGDGPIHRASAVMVSPVSSSHDGFDRELSIASDEKGQSIDCKPEHPPLPSELADIEKNRPRQENDSPNPLTQRIAHALHLLKRAALEQPTARVTWLVTLYFGLEWGNEIALSGWNVTFMEKVRHASEFDSTMTNMGFWIAFSIGRIVLGFVTAGLGEVFAVTSYLLIVIVSQSIYWLVPNFYVSAVTIAIDGFFLGPVFPAAVFMMGRLLPEELHVVAMSLTMALGLAIGEILPFIAGVIAQKRGVKNIMPLVLAMVITILAIWLALTRPNIRIWRKKQGVSNENTEEMISDDPPSKIEGEEEVEIEVEKS